MDDYNSTRIYRSILKHELELKWIQFIQLPHSLGFYDNIYGKCYVSRLIDFDGVFSSLRYL